MDPKKGTKGRRIDGGESDDAIKSAFFQAPPRWRRTHFERRVQRAEESERRGFRRPGSICAKLTIIRAAIARMPRMGKIHHGVRRPEPEGYTLTHGAPVAGWPICVLVVLGTLAIMAVWTITIATYFTFRGSDNRSRPDKSSVRWAPPAAQPAHTCTTKRESRAIQWTRRSSCAAERDSMGAFELKTPARA